MTINTEAERYAEEFVMQDGGAVETESEFESYKEGLRLGYIAGVGKYEPEIFRLMDRVKELEWALKSIAYAADFGTSLNGKATRHILNTALQALNSHGGDASTLQTK